VRGNDELPTFLRLLAVAHHSRCDVESIEVILGLVDDKRVGAVRAEQQTQQDGALLTR
jgi:hypothetical protein